MNEHYNNNRDDANHDERIIPKWFYLPYCDESETYRECTNNICSHHPSHSFIITCNYCQNDFKAFIDNEVRCSTCCR